MPFLPVTPEEAIASARDVYHGHGKIEILPKVLVRGLRDLAVAHTPGVGHVVRHLIAHPEALHEQVAKDNMIALVTDGTAVLGFGNVGPYVGMPVMEGKAVMFKLLAGIDCMPLCLSARGPSHLVDIVEALQPSFGGFNIEDVAAPACFEVMRELDTRLDVPALHDDQFGAATVVAAGVLNALKLLGRKAKDTRAVLNGIGAAGTATVKMLQAIGIGDILAVDRVGILRRNDDLAHAHWREIAESTNVEGLSGDLAIAMKGADLFVGLSAPRLVTPAMVRSMNADPIVFGLANPEPEILPHEARAAGAAVTASGRFDFPNQCNNVLAFPGLFRGILDSKARRVSLGMCLAAARAIAAAVPAPMLDADNILPSPLDGHLHAAVAEAVAQAAVAEGLARVTPAAGAVAEHTRHLRHLLAMRQEALAREGAESL
ncbi:MAG: NADP-dependent malic enzyme [Rhizobiaceae bacterium]|nr:NADP-dependent malic enzyme [Rhizobiaceae bacterium]